MKEFNLEEFKKDPTKKVVTRDGRDVRIICTNFLSNMNKPIIALIKEDENKESAWNFTKNGKYHLPENKESLKDLFFAPIKKKGWVNLFKNEELPFINKDIYKNEKDAKEAAIDEPDFIASVKIEWEE